MNPDTVQIAPLWKNALRDEILSPYFDQLVEKLKKDKSEEKTIFPPGNLIFNAYNTVNPEDVKVVIIGQDPYHNPGEAMGLSFSVPRRHFYPSFIKKYL
jgi:uracil-DNA glycosylase